MVQKSIDWMRKSPILSYFGLVFITEWFLFFALSGIIQPMVAILIGSWLPNCIGVLVTYVSDGKPGLRILADKIVLWQVDRRWYLSALLAPGIAAAIALGINSFFLNQRLELAPQNQIPLILVSAIFTGALGEELGWRGTALPRLQGRFTPIMSSLILGCLWGIYHLPAFYLVGSLHEDVPIVPFMIGSVELTLLMTWTFNRTRGSLIPVFLYHFSFNFTLSITGLPANPLLFWLFVIVTGLMTISVVAFDWQQFSRPSARLNSEIWKIG